MLVIESHIDHRTTLHELLDTQGWFTMSTGRGRDALTLARGSAPQLVLLDLHLTDMSSLLLARQLRAACSDSLIILGMTTNPMTAEVTHARDARVDSILLKPFELDFTQLAFLIEPFN